MKIQNKSSLNFTFEVTRIILEKADARKRRQEAVERARGANQKGIQRNGGFGTKNDSLFLVNFLGLRPKNLKSRVSSKQLFNQLRNVQTPDPRKSAKKDGFHDEAERHRRNYAAHWIHKGASSNSSKKVQQNRLSK